LKETLDPTDWEDFRALGRRMLDDLIEHMAGLREGPVWQPTSAQAKAALSRPVPWDPTPLASVYQDFLTHVLPFPTGNAHPRFFGWVMGNGTAEGMLADLLASGMNPHVGGYDQSATLVERQVLAWLREIMGYPADSGALLVSGGTMANLIGVMVARNSANPQIRDEGVLGGRRLRVYGSVETHSWIEKSADLLGLGRSAMRRVAVDERGRIDLRALASAVAADRAAGEQPLCVIGNAGTVDGGVIDDLWALADFCADQGLWFHVDGAFGAVLTFSRIHRERLRGLERSDSMAFDLHKWGYLQYELGCVLVRDQNKQRATFVTDASYLEPLGRGIQPDALEFSALGPQLSRGFRALRVWIALRHHGIDKIGRVIDGNVEQAQRLVERIVADPRLELLGPAPLNVVCFRYRPPACSDERRLKAINREILLQLQESGEAVPSSTQREGRFALRVAITNHRTRLSDIDRLADAVLKLGARIADQIS